MRSAKRYTNETFTRRVDHQEGSKQPPAPPRHASICAGCGAVHANRRWYRGEDAVHARLGASAPLDVIFCPACLQRRSGVAHGYVHVDGEFLAQHRTDIEALLHAEARRAAEDNPTSQVLDWGDDGTGGLLITTSTEHLAQRLGRALEKAYQGKTRYGFSHENKLAHVWWHR